jgi:protein TonB
VGADVQKAKLIRQVQPTYPPAAIQTRIQGTVKLRAFIGKAGDVKKLDVIEGHPLLVPAAMAAVKQWRYRPTLLNGTPVEVITQIHVNFGLARSG